MSGYPIQYAKVQPPPLREETDRAAMVEKTCGQSLVIGIERRKIGPKRHPGRTGKGGDGDQIIWSLLIREADGVS